MNTTTISPALEMVAPKPTQGHANKQSDADSAPRFSEVLSHQHASQSSDSSKHPSAPASSKQKENAHPDTRDSENTDIAEDLSRELVQLAGQAGIVAAAASQPRIDKIAAGLREQDGNAERPPHFIVKPDPTGAASQLTAETATAKGLNELRFSAHATPVDAKTDKPAVDALMGKADTAQTKTERPMPETGNLHQSARPEGKARQLANSKAAQVMVNGNGGSPKAGQASGTITVSEFSAAMVDAAAHAQSRLANNGLQETAINATASGEHALAHSSMATSGSTSTQNGGLAALPGTATPLSSPQWASDFGRQFVNIAQNSSNGTQVAELRLDPPELGPLRITINLSDNVAHAAFFSAHAMVRQTVENALPQLQQLLEQAGISLGDTSVNDQSQAGQDFDDRNNNSHAGSRTGPSAGLASADAMAPPERVRNTAPDALVDTFA